MRAAEAIPSHAVSGIPPAPVALAIDAAHVTRRFGIRSALDDVSLAVAPGEVHALLGPNGAGKTTLLRVLCGLIRPDAGSVSVLGVDAAAGTRAQRAEVGLVPSGDRSFYLRLSGAENLLFFARLHGFRRLAASERSRAALRAVGLEDVANVRVGEYSHGMQKRLSFARGLLATPRVLLVDEATHDLDPHAARVVRELTLRIAEEGTAIVWATQRLEEIRGFAGSVTLLRAGSVRFAGSVERLAANVQVKQHVVRVTASSRGEPATLEAVRRALVGRATVEAATEEAALLRLQLHDGVSLGAALAELAGAGFDLVSCREVQSEIEEAFVRLTGAGG